MTLANLSIYYTWENIKSAYKNKKIKISASTWNVELHLLDGSYSISDMQDYFEYIIKKHETKQTILPCKFMGIESKIGLFLIKR